MTQPLTVVLAPEAPLLLRQAAADLAGYGRALFGLETRVGADTGQGSPSSPASERRLLLGCAADPHVLRAGGSLPHLSDQGFLLRRLGPQAFLLVGGSAAAAAWAAYRLAEHWGVRYLLHGDVVPAAPEVPPLPPLDEVCEPLLRLRSWRQFNDLPTGPALWTIDQQRAFLRQAFKLTYNGVYLSLWPQHPFVRLEAGGIRQQTGTLLFGQRIPVDADTPGRQRLPAGMAVLDHPDLWRCANFEERLAAGRALVAGILDAARFYQMHTAIHIQPLEFPAEFSPLLQQPTGGLQLGSLTTAEGGDLTHPGHLALVRATLDAYLEQWGDRVDELSLHLPEHPQAQARFQDGWRDLDGRYGVEAVAPLARLLEGAEANHLIPGGLARARREVRSAIAMLHFFDRFFAGNDVLRRAAATGVDVHLGLGGNSEALFPILERVLWPGAGINTSLGYTASRAVRAMECMESLDAGKVPATLILTFQDDNVGWLPQVASGSHDLLLAQARRLGWRGFFTRHWPIGDLDGAAAFAARACWDERATPSAVWDDYCRHVYGEAAAPDMVRAFRLLEEATVVLDLDFLGVLFPVLGILSRSLEDSAPAAEGLFHLRAQYQQVARLLQRVEPRVAGAVGRGELAYWKSRIAFSVEVLRGKELVHQGSAALRTARQAADPEARPRGLADAAAMWEEAARAGERGLASAAAQIRDEADATSTVAYYHFLVRQVRQEAARLIAQEAGRTAEPRGADGRAEG